MNEVEQKLVDIKFILDMYNARSDTPESTLEKIQEVLIPKTQLNDNQKIVLEWLKKQRIQKDGLILPPMESISNLLLCIQRSSGDIFRCFASMSGKQQFEVLTAFAQWGLEQEGTE